MTASRKVTFFHSPNTRSTGTRILLEELGADYDLHVLNIKAGEQRAPAYLTVNPMGKVPAIRHGDDQIILGQRRRLENGGIFADRHFQLLGIFERLL